MIASLAQRNWQLSVKKYFCAKSNLEKKIILFKLRCEICQATKVILSLNQIFYKLFFIKKAFAFFFLCRA